MKDVKRSIVLPEEMAKLLDQMAEEQDVSFSGLVRRFVRQGLSHNPDGKKIKIGIAGRDRDGIRGLCRVLGMQPRECALHALRQGILQLSGGEEASQGS